MSDNANLLDIMGFGKLGRLYRNLIAKSAAYL